MYMCTYICSTSTEGHTCSAHMTILILSNIHLKLEGSNIKRRKRKSRRRTGGGKGEDIVHYKVPSRSGTMRS